MTAQLVTAACALRAVLDLVPDEWLEPAHRGWLDPAEPFDRRTSSIWSRRLASPGALAAAGPVMSALLGYQYVVLRCVPSAVREEFLNVGVVLYCQQAGFLQVAWSCGRRSACGRSRRCSTRPRCARRCRPRRQPAVTAPSRAAPTSPASARGSAGWPHPRSTVLRPGPGHGGLTTDPAAELARLLAVLVEDMTRAFLVWEPATDHLRADGRPHERGRWTISPTGTPSARARSTPTSPTPRPSSPKSGYPAAAVRQLRHRRRQTGRRGADCRAVVVLAHTRADVNGVVRRTLDVRKLSFMSQEAAVERTGMEYGGITPLGLPAEWPIYVDASRRAHATGDDRIGRAPRQAGAARSRPRGTFPARRSSTGLARVAE